MTTPTIQFLDSIGAVTITATGLSLNNWLPDVDEVNDRATPMGTQLEEFWRYARYFWASLEVPHIKAANLGNLHRLKSHLLTGGFITINTNDSASRVYTCSIKPGSTPKWSFADRQQLEYTLSLDLRTVAPYPMICDYGSGYTGTTDNEVTNGGGETGTVGSQATGWTKTSGSALVPATDSFVLGSRALKVVNADTASSRNSQSSISVTAGERWLLSGWVKSTALTAGGAAGASIDLTTSTAAWTLVKQRGGSRDNTKTTTGHVADGAAHDWGYVYVLVDVTTSGTVAVDLALATTGAGTAWFDGVRFEPVEAV